jgi:hypothetical protein
MDADERWQQYLFRGHSQRELEEWARSLQVFRFVRARGGHANDGDSLLAVARYSGAADLGAFLAALGVQLNRLPMDAPEPVSGRPYSFEDWSRFPSKISNLRQFEQPKTRGIAGAQAFLWVLPDRVEISLPVGRYDVTAEDVANARQIEKFFVSEFARFVDPPVDDKHCICPRYYPEFFR